MMEDLIDYCTESRNPTLLVTSKARDDGAGVTPLEIRHVKREEEEN